LTLTRERIFAVLVFVYTASGAVFGFLAVLAVSEGRTEAMFLYIFIATMIDYTDGSIARYLRIYKELPAVAFDKLDSVVDFLNNALIPAFALWLTGRLPQPSLLWAAAILLSSLFRYSKSYDPYIEAGLFRGLPVLWVFLLFYAFQFAIPRFALALIITAMTTMAFTSWRFIHVARFPRARAVNSLALVAWWVIFLLVTQHTAHATWLAYASLLYPVYYLTSSYFLGRTPELTND
jgi:phosphatidylcholine synthase